MKKNSPSKITIGIALFVLGALVTFVRPQADAAIVGPSEPIIMQNFELPKQIDYTRTPKKVIVPELSINIDVAPANIKNGYWEVFEDVGGWGVGSAYPGETGNSVIFAHARDGLFGNLRSIKKGVTVFVLTEKNWYEYKVEEIKEVSPFETEVIAPTTDQEKLTLFTCSGYNDNMRLVVTLVK